MALKTEKQTQAELNELTERISALRKELEAMVHPPIGTSGRVPKTAAMSTDSGKKKPRKGRR